MKGRAGWPAALVASLLLGAVPLAGCGDDGAQSSDVPDDAVAVIGDSEISEAALEQRVTALSRAQPRTAAGQAQTGQQLRQQVEQQALSLLLIAEATEQEAAERGIAVSEADARQRWQSVARKQFPTRRALRRFLGGQTEGDVVDQLRIQMLTEQINAQVAAEAGGGRRGEQAVRRFQKEFAQRWQEETACREGLSAAGCQDGD